MTAFATYVCDGCATETVEIPMPDGRALARLIDALHEAHWATPLRGVWLCPTCAEITQVEPVEAATEAMF